jgi:hypothetical protein
MARKERTNMFDGQMEMSFGRAANHSARRQNRARWWFQRMRQVVDLAIDWQPTPRPRPIQIWFPVTETKNVLSRQPDPLDWADDGVQRTSHQPAERRVAPALT